MAKEFVDGEIQSNPVVVFSKTYCPFCKMAKTALKDAGAKFKTIELDERGQRLKNGDLLQQVKDHIAILSTLTPLGDGDAIQDYLQSITGGRTVPRVFINGKFVGGGSEVRDLHQSGKLVPMLKDAGAL